MINKHISLLGHKVKDSVTGDKGIVTSICFDLYGCIQAVVTPVGKNNDRNSKWFDISRLTITSKKPVMLQPNFMTGDIAEGWKGPADKPEINNNVI